MERNRSPEDDFDHVRKTVGHVHDDARGDIRETTWRHPPSDAAWIPFAWGGEPAARVDNRAQSNISSDVMSG